MDMEFLNPYNIGIEFGLAPDVKQRATTRVSTH